MGLIQLPQPSNPHYQLHLFAGVLYFPGVMWCGLNGGGENHTLCFNTALQKPMGDVLEALCIYIRSITRISGNRTWVDGWMIHRSEWVCITNGYYCHTIPYLPFLYLVRKTRDYREMIMLTQFIHKIITSPPQNLWTYQKMLTWYQQSHIINTTVT